MKSYPFPTWVCFVFFFLLIASFEVWGTEKRKTPLIRLQGFDKQGAVEFVPRVFRHPQFTYAWYPRPFGLHDLGNKVEYSGIVMENNGVIGIASHPRGFQSVQADGLILGSIVKVSGTLVLQLERLYWTDYAIDSEKVEILYLPEEVEKEKAKAKKLWGQFVGGRSFKCFTSKRNYTLNTSPKLNELMVNWDGERGVFIFSFSESTGRIRSQLVREFFFLVPPNSNQLIEVEGNCYFWEDLC